MDQVTQPTLDLLLAGYLSNRSGTDVQAMRLPPAIGIVPTDIAEAIWDDCVVNLEMSLKCLFYYRDQNLVAIADSSVSVINDEVELLLTDTVFGRPVETMDMYDVIASVATVFMANNVTTADTTNKLTKFISDEAERYTFRKKVMRGYMSDALVFFIGASEGVFQKGLREFRMLVGSLPAEIEKLTELPLEPGLELDNATRNQLQDWSYAILESFECVHYPFVNRYMEEMQDFIRPAQLSAIYTRDWENAPLLPMEDVHDGFNGLLTLWFFRNSKYEYIEMATEGGDDENK